MGDRWGRAKTMMLTILVYSGFTGLSALSRNQWDFMSYRFLTGLGVGGEFAAGVTLVAEVMPEQARAHALGMLQALSALGNVIGSAISFIVLPLGWRWMFTVGILPALLVVAGVPQNERTGSLAEDAGFGNTRRGQEAARLDGRPVEQPADGEGTPSSGCSWRSPVWWVCGASASGRRN